MKFYEQRKKIEIMLILAFEAIKYLNSMHNKISIIIIFFILAHYLYYIT